MKIKKKYTQGFTLVELIVVITILGILIAMTVPSFSGYIKKQKENDAIADCKIVVAAAQSIYDDGFAKNTAAISTSISPDLVMQKSNLDGSLIGNVVMTVTSPSGSGEKVASLLYQSENGIFVQYDYSTSPYYTISDGEISNITSLTTTWESFLTEYMGNNGLATEQLSSLRRSIMTDYYKNYDPPIIPESYAKDLLGTWYEGPYYWYPYPVVFDGEVHTIYFACLTEDTDFFLDTLPGDNVYRKSPIIQIDGVTYYRTDKNLCNAAKPEISNYESLDAYINTYLIGKGHYKTLEP